MNAPNGNAYSAHRTAIALNNMGITLLERQEFHLAHEALMDAVLTMKFAIHPTLSCDEIHRSNTLRLERAVNNLASTKCRSGEDLLQISAFFDEDIASMKAFLQSPILGARTCLIRIESAVCGEDPCTDTDAALILYNAGVANMFMAKVVDCPSEAMSMLAGSIKLLSISHSIMGEIIKSCDDSIEQVRFILLGSIIISNMIGVLSLQGKQRDADLFKMRLEGIEDVIRDIEESTNFVSDLQARDSSAPAA